MPGYADLINKQMQQIGQPNVTTIERDVPFQWESILPILFMLLQGMDKPDGAPKDLQLNKGYNMFGLPPGGAGMGGNQGMSQVLQQLLRSFSIR